MTRFEFWRRQVGILMNPRTPGTIAARLVLTKSVSPAGAAKALQISRAAVSMAIRKIREAKAATVCPTCGQKLTEHGLKNSAKSNHDQAK